MLAALRLPTELAISFAENLITVTSSRSDCRLISDELISSTPPSRTSPSNLSSEGRFMASTARGVRITGEPTGRSEITTVQLQVPPRISGPYEGSQETSLPSLIPA